LVLNNFEDLKGFKLNMLTIGLTGGIGSGKTMAGDIFTKLGVQIIDTDLIAREIVEPDQPAYNAIVSHFGPIILDGTALNRKALKNIVFNDKTERLWLESLMHPLIRTTYIERAKAAQSPYCIVIVPLLLETSPNSLIDRILLIDCPEELQVERVMSRDGMTKDQVYAIVNTQAQRSMRINKANDVIDNTGSLTQLHEKVESMHAYYLSLTK
jgi:dephospho-CoA kinase